MIWLRHFLKGVETLYCRIVPWNLMHMNRYNHIWSLFLSFTFNDSHFCNNSSLSKMVIGNNHCSPNRMSINAPMFQIQLLLLPYVEKIRQKDKLSNAKFWKLNSDNLIKFRLHNLISSKIYHIFVLTFFYTILSIWSDNSNHCLCYSR